MKTVNYNATTDLIDKQDFYIAHHNGGFDEIQRLTTAYLNNQPTVIEGDPGVGKNQAIKVIEAASNTPAYRIRCTEEMTARDIIGGEKLGVEKNGDTVATKTVFTPGKLYQAMMDGSIAILDEVNQLPPTVQKGLNSALEDIKTIGYIEGGADTKAKEGFGLFLTYNPGTGIANQDLEKAVRDRCKILYFEDFPAELKARIALLRSGKFDVDDIMQNGVDYRGIHKNGTLNFATFDGEKWYTGDEPLKKGKVTPYLHYNKNEARPLEFDDEKKQEYAVTARHIVETFNDIKKLKTEGTRYFREEYGWDLERTNRMNLNVPSTRLLLKTVDDYISLRQRGVSKAIANQEVTTDIVDAAVPSSERFYKIGNDMTVEKLVKTLAHNNGLLDDEALYDISASAKRQLLEKIIEEIQDRGYKRSVAEKLAHEFV